MHLSLSCKSTQLERCESTFWKYYWDNREIYHLLEYSVLERLYLIAHPLKVESERLVERIISNAEIGMSFS